MADGSIEVGKKAPAFSLPDAEGRKWALKDLSGQWVVLYFYPKDDTPGCTTQACDFTASHDEFAGMDAMVMGVSRDDAGSHRKFIDKHALKVTLLTDADAKVMRKYGAFGEKKMYGKTTEGVIRSTVLIDPKGKVAHHWANVRAKGHAEKVKEKLAELRAAANQPAS